MDVRTLTLFGLLTTALLGAPALAQESTSNAAGGNSVSAPKPPPELEKLKAESDTGRGSTCEGHHSEMPGCPAGPTHSTFSSWKAELGGFWYVAHEEGSTCGPYKVLEIQGYDHGKKKFVNYRFYDFGAYQLSTSDNADGPWTGTFVMNGKETPARATLTVKNDHESIMTIENQVDGQWKKTGESVCRKQ